MNDFTLRLRDATHGEDIAGVTSFVGEDASGSFGLLAGHAPMMTLLAVGLARFRVGEGPWQYLAMPGAVLYGRGDSVTLDTRHYLLDSDYNRISTALRERLLAEEEALRATRNNLRHLEEEVLRRMWELGRGR